MRDRLIALPELALFGATRGMIGFGIGLLISDRIGRDRRKQVGFALVVAGALSTIPLAMRMFRRRTDHQQHRRVDEPRSPASASMTAS
jgi:hypothetical protein